jgi:hypothetical protein
MQELDYNPSKKDLTDARIHHLLSEELKPYRRVSFISLDKLFRALNIKEPNKNLFDKTRKALSKIIFIGAVLLKVECMVTQCRNQIFQLL